MVGYQWDDDSKSLYRKWLEITISIHPFINGWPWGSRYVYIFFVCIYKSGYTLGIQKKGILG